MVLLTMALAVAACSAIKLGYSTLPEVAYWWLDGYVEFTDTQAPLVRQDLARLQAWHRREELPRFVQMLQRMEQLAPRDIQPEEACTFVAEFRERLLAVANQAEPAVVALATGLSAAQREHVRRRYDKNNAAYTSDWIRLAPEERREKRYRQFLDRAEAIYGSLDAPQREALRRDIDRTPFDPAFVLAERQRRQGDLLRTLERITRAGGGFEEARLQLRGYLQRAVTPPEPAARAEQERLLADGCRHFAVLHNATTPGQRENAVRRLRAYQRELRELAANE